ncbi:MAG: hypothetical protein ACM3ZE_17015 [Myxococcales bacterium]
MDATAEDNPNTLQQIGMSFDVSIQVLGDLTPPVRDKRWRSSNIDHQTEALPALPQFRKLIQMGRELFVLHQLARHSDHDNGPSTLVHLGQHSNASVRQGNTRHSIKSIPHLSKPFLTHFEPHEHALPTDMRAVAAPARRSRCSHKETARRLSAPTETSGAADDLSVSRVPWP